VRRLLAPLLLGLAIASWMSAACEDDSVYRSGDPPPSIVADSGLNEGGGSAGPGDIDAGSD
jgi:hypothetical protein